MPTPTVPPPPRERPLPANFDDLVRKAMSGQGGVAALKQALAEPPPEAPPAPRPVPAPARAAPAATAAADREPPALPAAALTELMDDPAAAECEPEASTPSSLLRRAADQLDALGGTAPTSAALRAAQQALAAAQEALARLAAAEAPAEVPIPLPPTRHAYALVIGGSPSQLTDASLATALRTDVATAKQALLAGGTRVVLRSPVEGGLTERAEAVRALGARAAVVTHASLRRVGPAVAVVGVDSLDVWRLVESPIWRDRPDPTQLPRGAPSVLATPLLLVVGEVQEKRMRAPPADTRWSRTHYAAATGAGGEERWSVLDVHLGDRILRLTEGLVDLRGAPNLEEHSGRRSLARFIEALVARYPSVPAEPRRVCVATPQPGELRADGWAAWEEHSRACRAIWGLG